MGKFWFLYFFIFVTGATFWAQSKENEYGEGLILTTSDQSKTIYFFLPQDSKSTALLHFKSIGGGALEGKSMTYQYEDQGQGRAEVFFEQKKGSKKNRFVILSKRQEFWSFQDPNDYQRQFSLAVYVPSKEKKVLSIDKTEVFKKIEQHH